MSPLKLRSPTSLLFYTILWLLYTRPSSAAQCSKGCLKCLSSGECVVCDISNNYARISGTCIKNTIDNCLSRNFNGNCLICEKGYFLDLGKCVSAESNVLDNCEVYFTATSCQQCSLEHYLYNGECLRVGQSIPNCLIYNSDASKCTQCVPGMMLSLDLLSCDAVVNSSPVANCMSYSQIGCKECKSGYSVNLNKYLVDASKLDAFSGKRNDDVAITTSNVSYLTRNLESLLLIELGNLKNNTFEFCIHKSIDNCREFFDFDKCQTCEDNFILTPQFDCLEYPNPKIQNCSKYSDKTLCRECENKYYLSDDKTQCLESVTIPNCVKYSFELSNTCIECSSKFYVNNGSCLERNFESIQKCIENAVDSDGCETCDLGFTTNSTAQLCVASVGNCLEYNRAADSVSCSICFDGFFLETSTKCTKGALNGCKRYTDQNSCSICEPGFYLNGFVCAEHSQRTQVFNCLDFSTTHLNKCNQCDRSSVSYTNSGFCLAVDKIISGCKRYSDSLNCESCFEDSSYLSDNQCVVGNIASCVEYHESQNECLTCKIDFEKNESYVTFPASENNKCYLGNPNIHNNCRQMETAGELEKCTVCETQHYPIAHVSNKLSFCVPRDFYKLYSDDNSGTVNVDYEKINFCELWDYTEQECLKCKIRKVISSSGSCVDTCEDQERLETFKFNKDSADEVFLQHYFKCTDSNENYGTGGFKNAYRKCYRYETHLTNTRDLCMECDSTSIGVIDFDSNKQINGIFRYIPNSLIAEYSLDNSIMPLSDCVSRTTSTIQPTSSDVTNVITIDGTVESDFNNCRFVMKIGADSFGCVACDFGFSGKVVQDKDFQGNFIKNCLSIDSCEKSTYYNGLGSLPLQSSSDTYYLFPLDFYSSCHKCSSGKIPTISILKSQIANSISNSKGIAKFIYPFAFASATTSDIGTQIGTNGTVTSCQTNGMGKIGLQNCGMMQYFIDMPITQYEVATNANDNPALNDAANPLCIACLPGNKPTMSDNPVNAFAMTACAPIPFCNSEQSFTFNKCDVCAGEYSLVYDSNAPNKMTLGLECVASAQTNCLVYDTDLTRCVKCAKGYVLNIDFICDATNSFECEEPGYFTKDVAEVSTNFSLTGHGCNRCTNDFISMRFDNILSTCVQSQSLKPGSNSVSSFLISNCSFYGFNANNEIICAQCNEISISSESRKHCFITPNSLENCLFVQDTSNENNIKCSVCEDYFYKDDFDYCLSGNILNCVKYASTTECSQCQSGYFLTQVKDGRIICVKPNSQPCKEYSQSSALIGDLKCSLCDSNFYFTDDAQYGIFPLTDCLTIPKIENCVEYDNVGGILNSTLSCVKCEPLYYVLTSLRCSERKKQIIENCLEMNIAQDKCGVCSEGYFVNDDGDCELYPSGVIDCIEYKDEKNCIKCERNYYLINNECVRSTRLVKDCYYYRGEGLCNECRPGFFLSNTECQLGDAINCKTFKNKNECETCPDGYGLIPDNDNLSCIEIKIDNCTVPDVNSRGPNFKCLQCDVGFYVNENYTCTAVPAQIEFCGIYATSDTCELCFNNYVLVSNKKKCVLSNTIEDYIDRNCLNSFISPEPICNVCQLGFYFQVPEDKMLISPKSEERVLAADGNSARAKTALLKNELEGQTDNQCVACPNSGEGGCAVCYPKNPEFCSMCSSGYTHDSNGTCELTEPKPPAPPDIHVMTLRSVWMGLLILLVCWVKQ